MQFAEIAKLNMPSAVRDMKPEELKELADAVRAGIIATVSKNGGHLASSLGCVELTVAMLKVLDLEKDHVIWDVGHQSYAYKILTDRAEAFETLRKKDGISGFPKPRESRYDAYATGHSGNAVSAAFGMAAADAAKGSDAKTVAVIGDASFSNGMVFEALNHLGNSKKNLIIILNDNGRSIAKNHGAFARYLLRTRTRMSYYNTKKRVERFFKAFGIFGKPFLAFLNWIKRLLKAMLLPTTLFESLGVDYLGPIDGHNIDDTVAVLKRACRMNKPVLVHVTTVKGKGYEPAATEPEGFHGVSGFDVETGKMNGGTAESFSAAFGETLTALAESDGRICAVTAAMASGTGLSRFREKFPERFYDVGIAEEHGVSFCCGLAAEGMKPVFAVYSAFLQRAYDQLLIEAAFQQLPVVFAVDRAGIVGEDGETHQGLFDAAYLTQIPNMTVYAPAFRDELGEMLKSALALDTPSAVRYPRGGEGEKPEGYAYTGAAYDYRAGGDVLAVTYGRIFSELRAAVDGEKLPVSVLKLNRIKPLSIPDAALKYKTIVFFEEGIKTGGIAEQTLTKLTEAGWRGRFVICAVDDGFVPHSTVSEALADCGLDRAGIAAKLKELVSAGDNDENADNPERQRAEHGRGGKHGPIVLRRGRRSNDGAVPRFRRGR